MKKIIKEKWVELVLTLVMALDAGLGLSNLFGVSGQITLGIWQLNSAVLLWVLMLWDKLIKRQHRLIVDV